MNALSFPGATIIELSEAERSALVWAIEVARALRLDDADVRVLLADPSISVALLDDLADSLVSIGKPHAAIGARDGDLRRAPGPSTHERITRREDGADGGGEGR